MKMKKKQQRTSSPWADFGVGMFVSSVLLILSIVAFGRYAVYPVAALALLATIGYLGHSANARSRQRNEQQANYYRPKN